MRQEGHENVAMDITLVVAVAASTRNTRDRDVTQRGWSTQLFRAVPHPHHLLGRLPQVLGRAMAAVVYLLQLLQVVQVC